MDDETELNRRAFFALRGGSEDILGDLISLLRSDEEIARAVRDGLADVLDTGLFGIRLELTGEGPAKAAFVSRNRRLLWMKMARWMEARIASGEKRKDAITAAEKEFGAGEK